MPVQDTSPKLVQFGVFELDLQQGELRKQGVKVKLQDQPLKILQLLLETPREIVSRDELRSRIWPADTFVEFDKGLYSAMARLRDALGDTSDSPRFIETVPKRGYRFIAPVIAIPAETIPVAPGPRSTSSKTSELETAWKHFSFRRLAASVLAGLFGGALLLLAVLSLNIAGARAWIYTRSHPIRSIAVLPLENLSGDPEQEYFADGMTDELITSLAKLGDLRVVSRTSVMRYKKVSKPIAQIGHELNVDALVEGTVERANGRVRIRVQLLNADTDRHLWAQTYDRELRDTLSLQSQAAADIVSQIHASIAPGKSRPSLPRPVDPKAYEAYLRGLYFSNKRTDENFTRAIDYFQQAIAADPNYAVAYAGLSDAYFGQAFFGKSPQVAREKARATAFKSLELDGTLAEAHNVAAAVLEFFDWDWPGAEKEYRRAIELNPNFAAVHQGFGMFLVLQGRFDEGLAEAQRSQELDPLSVFVRSTYCMDLLSARQFDRASKKCLEALELDPHYYHSDCHLAQIYETTMKYDQSFEELEKCAIGAGEPPARLAALRDAFQHGGIAALRKKQLDLSLQRIPNVQDSYYELEDAYQIAALYSGFGQPDQAFLWLDKAYSERSLMLRWTKDEPAFDSLRSDPRFAEFLRKLRL